MRLVTLPEYFVAVGEQADDEHKSELHRGYNRGEKKEVNEKS